MKTDKQRIELEKDFREFLKSMHGEKAWKKYIGSELEAVCVNFIKQKIDQLEAEKKDLIEKNKHLQNFARHTEFCAWLFDGDAKCDCGYIKQK